MAKRAREKTPSIVLEENLKKALTEMLVLHALSAGDRYIGDIINSIHEKSGKVLTIVFPYSAIYRLETDGYLVECGKHIAPDRRRRQYYRITDAGRLYLKELEETYRRFTEGVFCVLSEEAEPEK